MNKSELEDLILEADETEGSGFYRVAEYVDDADVERVINHLALCNHSMSASEVSDAYLKVNYRDIMGSRLTHLAWPKIVDVDALAAREDNDLHNGEFRVLMAKGLVKHGIPEDLNLYAYGWSDYDYYEDKHGEIIGVFSVKDYTWNDDYNTYDGSYSTFTGLRGIIAHEDGTSRYYRAEMTISSLINSLVELGNKI